MLEMIESYGEGAISFPRLVGKLQGALDAGEFRDEALIKRWYDFWGPLEITNAVRGNQITYKEVAKDVEAMRLFLLKHLSTERVEKV